MVNDKLVNEFNNVGLFEGVEIDESLTTSAEEAMLESSGAVELRTFMAWSATPSKASGSRTGR